MARNPERASQVRRGRTASPARGTIPTHATLRTAVLYFVEDPIFQSFLKPSAKSSAANKAKVRAAHHRASDASLLRARAALSACPAACVCAEGGALQLSLEEPRVSDRVEGALSPVEDALCTRGSARLLHARSEFQWRGHLQVPRRASRGRGRQSVAVSEGRSRDWQCSPTVSRPCGMCRGGGQRSRDTRAQGDAGAGGVCGCV